MYKIKTSLTVIGDVTYSGDLIGRIPNPSISSDINNTIQQKPDGLFVPAPATYNGSTSIDITSNTVSAKISSTSGNQLSINGNGLYVPSGSIANQYLWVRDKSEVVYSGINLAITSTPTSLISLLKVLTPASGSLTKFFNTTSNKLNVYNLNSTIFF